MPNITLRPYQEDGVAEIRAAFAEKQSPVLFVLPTGGGKCLGKGTPILMYDGTVNPVENILVGDLLMGPDSQPRRVLSLARGREQLYRVTPIGPGRPYVVNASHILSLRNERGIIKNISVTEYLAEPRHWRIRNPGWRVPGVLRGDLTPQLSHIVVQPIGEGDYYGFEIDGDHLFMLGDFTVTHNTYTFSYIGSKAADLGNSVCIIVHRKELLLQASKSLRNLGIDHGMISPHFSEALHKLVQVASVDTLLNRLKNPKFAERFRPKLVIFDEAHHVTATNKWGRVWDMLGKPRMLGVTATPVRGDGIGLGEGHGGVFKQMVIGPLVAELIELGMLINPEVYTCLQPPDMDGVGKNKDGEYNMREVEERVDKPVITGSAVDHYKEICPGARTIVFCTSVKHARHVVEQFNAAGFRFALLVGEPEMSDAERTEVNRKLAAGELDGACTVDLVSEGYDLPDLVCCIMLRPTASESLFLQQVGRVMRILAGKTVCYLLDHVGNIGRMVDGKWKTKHGLPNAIREWSLEGRKRGKRKAKDEEPDEKLVQCGQCFHIFEPADCCPKCGAPVEKKAGGRKLEQVDGKLHKVDAELEAEMQQKKRQDQAGAKTVEEMMAKLGYSKTRAEAIVKAREEKAGLRDGLIADLRAWHAETGQTVLHLFHIHMADIRSMKPKALKDLRAQFDAHRERYTGQQQQQQSLLNNAEEEAA